MIKQCARNAQIRLLYDSGGVTLDDLGAAFGITRERVRQIIRAEGSSYYRHGKPCDPLSIVRHLREARSFADAAKRAAVSVSTVRTVARRLEMIDALERLYRMRQPARLSDAIRTAAHGLGRPLCRSDFSGPGRRRGMPAPNVLVRVFGSIPRAVACSGVRYTARHRGRPSIWNRETAAGALAEWMTRSGRLITWREASHDPSLPSGETVRKLFGSFRVGVTAALLQIPNASRS